MPNNAYFQGNPISLNTSRSRMPAHPRWTGTFNAGELVPIFATSLIMPGDTFKMDLASAVRLLTPRFPTMDDLDITIEAYFVPHRLVLSRRAMSPSVNDSNYSWEAFIGAQDSLLNMPTPGDVKLPTIEISGAESDGYLVGGLADCLGYPDFGINNDQGNNYHVNPLKFLAYYMIWNEYFREPNVQGPVTYTITNGEVDFVGSDAGIPANNGTYGALFPLAPVSRYHSYFGSALPWPQRNTTDVKLPLGDKAPVAALGLSSATPAASLIAGRTFSLGAGETPAQLQFRLVSNDSKAQTGSLVVTSGDVGDVTASPGTATKVYPANLWANLAQATAATINQVRLAWATQEWYEQLARGGNKYADLIASMYGVRGTANDSRPEYLGGFTAPINISQVANTADDLGATGAFSLSNPSGHLVTKSFTEHGTLMVVACVRHRDSFSQGIAREDTKFDRFDYYWSQFAMIGEQPILNKEIFVQAVPAADDAVFGYQEAWAEYRYFNDLVRCMANPSLGAGSLEYLTYCNKFSALPTLAGFLDASKQKDTVDRTLTTTSAAAGFQFVAQFQFNIDMVRPMPLYSIPSSLGHR